MHILKLILNLTPIKVILVISKKNMISFVQYVSIITSPSCWAPKILLLLLSSAPTVELEVVGQFVYLACRVWILAWFDKDPSWPIMSSNYENHLSEVLYILLDKCPCTDQEIVAIGMFIFCNPCFNHEPSHCKTNSIIWFQSYKAGSSSFWPTYLISHSLQFLNVPEHWS